MPRVLLRNHKVHYQQTGEGPDILLIHGLACHVAFWWFQVAPELAKTHRVTAVDLRGHGFSGVTETGYRACDLGADVAALLDHLGMADVHVVAHSFGGAVAMALASERPELVGRLTLADGWVPSVQPVPPLPKVRDWSATLVRAKARGIEVDPNLPLVVRGLYAEMMDETDFAEASASEVADDADGWEDDATAGSRMARFRERLPAFSGAREPGPLGRGRWLSAGRPLLGRFRRNADAPRPAADRVSSRTEDGGSKALVGAISVTGTPGRPSHGVRRWQDLMNRTNAKAEYLDTCAIEPSNLRDIAVPVHLVYGARSQYRPTAERLQDILPEARLTIIPRAGHYFPLLRPKALVAAVESQDPVIDGEKPHLRLVTAPETVASEIEAKGGASVRTALSKSGAK